MPDKKKAMVINSGTDGGDKSKQKQRRAILSAITAAGAVGAAKLPTQWSRPVIDSALLPVHADTSLCVLSCVGTQLQTTFSSSGMSPSVTFSASREATIICTRTPDGQTASVSDSESYSFSSTSSFPTTITQTTIVETVPPTAAATFCEADLSDIITGGDVFEFFETDFN